MLCRHGAGRWKGLNKGWRTLLLGSQKPRGTPKLVYIQSVPGPHPLGTLALLLWWQPGRSERHQPTTAHLLIYMGSLSTASEWSSPNCKAECKSSFKLGNPQHNMVIFLYHSSECFCLNTFSWFNLFDCLLPRTHPGKISITLFTSIEIRDLHSKVMLLPALLILFDLPWKCKCDARTGSPG